MLKNAKVIYFLSDKNDSNLKDFYILTSLILTTVEPV